MSSLSDFYKDQGPKKTLLTSNSRMIILIFIITKKTVPNFSGKKNVL